MKKQKKFRKGEFTDYTNKIFNREPHRLFGCDICHEEISTERFEGYVKGIVWICHKCYIKIKEYKMEELKQKLEKLN